VTEKLGVTVPIVPGIVSILSGTQIERFTALCGARIPPGLGARLAELGSNDEAVADFGIEYATRQCEDLLRSGIPGIHFYALNKSRAMLAVMKNLGLAARNL
jgi:methylenetetrahydrofolate reductase (NADPH)